MARRLLTPFPELDELLSGFARQVRAILDETVVGIYLTGSFALGGGDAASDFDIIVVTDGGVAAAQEAALREMHAEIPTRTGYWATNLEGSYAPKRDLETLAALGCPWLYVDRGAREMEWSAHCNTADVRWVLRERPLVVNGMDPCAFACAVPAGAVQCQARQQIDSFLDDLLGWTTFEVSWTQRYAVEAVSRMLYTLEFGEVISKGNALAWAREALPGGWHPLIDQVERDRFVRWDEPPAPGTVERTLAFVDFVQQRAGASDAYRAPD